MNNQEFQNYFELQVLRSKKTLLKKAEHYATDQDRMVNFNQAAGLNDSSAEEALWGMLTKHLVSVSTMVIFPDSYNKKIWREKLGDSLNYLFLLSAMVEERFEE